MLLPSVPAFPAAAPLPAFAFAACLAAVLAWALGRVTGPVPRFAAATAGFCAGAMLLQGPGWVPGRAAPLAACACLLAACLRPAVPLRVAPRPGAAPVTRLSRARPLASARAPRLPFLPAALLALPGGWWLAGAPVLLSLPRLVVLLLAAAALALPALLARAPRDLAAAALALAASFAAIGQVQPALFACIAAIVAMPGTGPLLPLAAALGAATAAPLLHPLPLAHMPHWPPGLLLAAASPALCLALLLWWRHRFARFGAAAAAIRAGCAVLLIALLAFSAAALAGLR